MLLEQNGAEIFDALHWIGFIGQAGCKPHRHGSLDTAWRNGGLWFGLGTGFWLGDWFGLGGWFGRGLVIFRVDVCLSGSIGFLGGFCLCGGIERLLWFRGCIDAFGFVCLMVFLGQPSFVVWFAVWRCEGCAVWQRCQQEQQREKAEKVSLVSCV